jgi:hypothetical protein
MPNPMKRGVNDITESVCKGFVVFRGGQLILAIVVSVTTEDVALADMIPTKFEILYDGLRRLLADRCVESFSDDDNCRSAQALWPCDDAEVEHSLTF